MLSDTTGLPVILEKCFAAIESEGEQQKYIHVHCSLVDLIQMHCVSYTCSTGMCSRVIALAGRY